MIVFVACADFERVSAVAEIVRELGHEPVFFCVGAVPRCISDRYEAKALADGAESAAEEIADYAALSQPAVVFEEVPLQADLPGVTRVRISELGETIGRVATVLGRSPTRSALGTDPLRIVCIAINGIGIGHVIRSHALVTALRATGAEARLVVRTNHAPRWAADLGVETIDVSIQTHEYVERVGQILTGWDADTVVFDVQIPLPVHVREADAIRFRSVFALSSLPSASIVEHSLTDCDVDERWLMHSEEELAPLWGETLGERIRSSRRLRLAGGPIRGIWPLAADVQPPSDPYLLVVLGGGGEHDGQDETSRMADLVMDLAAFADRRYGWRTVLIAGPNFAHGNRIDPARVVFHETARDMTAFARNAQVVVLRTGFNFVRELFETDTPAVALESYVFDQESERHLRFLADAGGMISAPLEAATLKDAVEMAHGRGRVSRRPRWRDGLPAMVARLTASNLRDEPLRKLTSALRQLPFPRLTIRVDDVIALDEPMRWLLAQLVARELHASLEIVPYANEITAAMLDDLDRAGLFEVSQHGYAHLPHRSGRRAEFYDERPADEMVARLRCGREIVSAAFGVRFRGGFSAPFDRGATALAATWSQLGGRYLSYVSNVPPESPLPVVRAGFDVWNWDGKRLYSAAAAAADLHRQMRLRGVAGLVLHPHVLTRDGDRGRILALLDALIAGGVRSIPLSAAVS